MSTPCPRAPRAQKEHGGYSAALGLFSSSSACAVPLTSAKRSAARGALFAPAGPDTAPMNHPGHPAGSNRNLLPASACNRQP